MIKCKNIEKNKKWDRYKNKLQINYKKIITKLIIRKLEKDNLMIYIKIR